jgi:hypothetical protein
MPRGSTRPTPSRPSTWRPAGRPGRARWTAEGSACPASGRPLVAHADGRPAYRARRRAVPGARLRLPGRATGQDVPASA